MKLDGKEFQIEQYNDDLCEEKLQINTNKFNKILN